MDEFVKEILEEKKKEVEIAKYQLLKSLGEPTQVEEGVEQEPDFV